MDEGGLVVIAIMLAIGLAMILTEGHPKPEERGFDVITRDDDRQP